MSRPIFVVGFQRSGTTLLQQLIGRHPAVAAAPEVHYFFRIYDLRDYYGDLRDENRLRRAIDDLLHPPIPLLDDCDFDAYRLFTRVRRRGADYASLLDELLLELAEQQGASRWAEKSPGQPLAQIVELFPDAQILHISRDVLDAVASSLATSWNDRSAAELAAQWGRFERSTRSAARQLGSDRYLPVRYEDLVKEPQQSLATVCQFLELEVRSEQLLAGDGKRSVVPSFAHGWLSKVEEPVDTMSIGRGRRSLSTEQQEHILAAVERAPDLSPPDPSPASPPTPEERYLATQEFFGQLYARAIENPAEAADA